MTNFWKGDTRSSASQPPLQWSEAILAGISRVGNGMSGWFLTAASEFVMSYNVAGGPGAGTCEDGNERFSS
jgi:hypothetical protein